MSIAVGILIAILKIIGTILLIFLSVVLFLILVLVLLLSISFFYELQVKKEDKLAYTVQIKWLFQALRVSYDQGGLLVTLLKWQLYPRIRKKKKRSKAAVAKKKKKSQEEASPPIPTQKEEALPTPEPPPLDMTADQAEPNNEIPSTETLQPDQEDSVYDAVQPEDQPEEEYNPFGKDFIIRYILELGVLNAVLKLIIRIMKAILPKRLSVSGVIGLSDPAATGKVLGLLHAFTGAFQLHNELTGNFESSELKLALSVSGRINIIQLIFYLVLFAFNKYIFRIIFYYIRYR